MKPKTMYLSVLRIVACFFVIASHTTIFAVDIAFDSSVFEWSLIKFYHILARTAVPIFFMISGFLYLNKQKTYKEMILKTFYRLLVPLFICSAVIYFKNNPILSLDNIIKFFKDLLNCNIVGSYWFIYVMAGLYLITPILQKLIKIIDQKDIKMYFIYFLVFVAIIPIFGHYDIFEITYNFNIPLVTTYLFYYIIGYYILSEKYTISNKKNIILIICSLVCILAGVILCYFDITQFKIDPSIYYGHGLFTILIPALCITYNIKNIFSKKKTSDKTNKIITTIANTTFCIYMIHVVFLGSTEFIFKYLIMKIDMAIFPSLFIWNIILFIGLTIFGIIINKLPLIKKIF